MYSRLETEHFNRFIYDISIFDSDQCLKLAFLNNCVEWEFGCKDCHMHIRMCVHGGKDGEGINDIQKRAYINKIPYMKETL